VGLLLNVDDIDVGMEVAVYGPARKARRMHRFHPATGTMEAMAAPEQHDHRVPPGVPMQVIGVSPPFVACTIIEPGGNRCSSLVILDLRETRLCRLLGEFVESIEGWQPEGVSGPSIEAEGEMGLQQIVADADCLDEEQED
jgi:hypothetical protein